MKNCNLHCIISAMLKTAHKFNTIFLFIFIFLFLCVNTACSFIIPPDSKVYIVGIGLNYSGANHLEGTVNDAAEFCTYYKYILDKKGIDNEVFYMLHMTNGENGNDYTNWDTPYAPSKENIKKLFENFANGGDIHEKIDENDLLVIYYSGHGAREPGATNDSSDNGAFCLLNEGQTNLDLYPHDEFINDLKQIDCTTVVISDSCFSGHLAGVVSDTTSEEYRGSVYEDLGKRDKYNVSFSTLKSVGNIHVIAASRASEYSFEGTGTGKFNNEPHGFFTGNALETMGLVHSDNVFGYVQPYSTDPNTKTHSSLSEKTLTVKGTVPSDDKIKNIRLTLNDLYSNSKTYTIDLWTGRQTQKTVRSTGPCDIILIW